MAKNAERPGRYLENDGLNGEGMEFPVNVSQIGHLEKQNEGLAINVFGWEDGGLSILRISGQSKAFPRINLMLIMDEEKSHYCWIKNLGRFLQGKTKTENQPNEKVLENHQELCEGVNGRPTRIEMPDRGSTLKFENWQKRQKVPYVIYADFESVIEKLPEGKRERTEKMEKTARHVPRDYAYTVVRSDGKSWSRK